MSDTADVASGADYLKTEPIAIPAGQHQVSVAFVRRSEGPYEDLIKPHEWSLASAGTGDVLSGVIAGLVATGTSEIGEIHHVDRGYEHLEERLQKIGADITRIN